MSQPIVPEPYDIRTSDAEREAVAEALRVHAGAGRLQTDELEERLERAYAAQTRADLVPLLADLPQAQPQTPPPAPRAARRRPLPFHVRKMIAIGVLLVAIWALSGAGYFWPIWPIAGMAFPLLAGRRAWRGYAGTGCARPSSTRSRPARLAR